MNRATKPANERASSAQRHTIVTRDLANPEVESTIQSRIVACESPRLTSPLVPNTEERLGDRLGLFLARRASLRFVIVFGATAGVLLATYYFPYPTGSAVRRLLDGYLRAYAALAGSVLRLFEPNLVVFGQDIMGRYSIRIVKTCDGMDVNILFASAIMAWPSTLRHRLIATGLGLALLVIANTARICTLYYVGVYAPTSFEFVHLELWPVVILALAVALFLVFIAKARPRGTALTAGERHPSGAA